ncbi:MAG: radical SAM protein [Polyangiaceae bacterium]|nr:radical SAM protein [Polyangiaceae bacterium]
MRIVTLSPACNNACVFCAQGKLREQPARQTPEQIVADAVGALVAGETVALVGGEPTLYDALPNFVRAFDAAGAGRIVVQTNGRRLAYRSFVRALREASSRLVLEVSIAGSTEPMHDYHTGTAGSFKQTIVGIRNARAERIVVYTSVVVTRSNFRHMSEMVRLAHALGATALRFVPAQTIGNARRAVDRVVPSMPLVAPYLALALAEGQKLGLTVLTDATGTSHEQSGVVYAGIGRELELEETFNDAQKPRRSLAIFGRPAPAVREERGRARRTGDDLREILPALFDGSAPRDVAEVVAASNKGAG